MAESYKKGSAASRTVMMLLDSNIIIYAVLSGDDFLTAFIRDNSPYVSDISRVEVLGFQNITYKEIEFYNSFFEATTLLAVSEEIILEAIRLRQKRKIALADSLIAATAIINDMTLVTRNTRDFKWIDSLKLIDPLEEK
jgi:predicted nucleic acid-binding protein